MANLGFGMKQEIGESFELEDQLRFGMKLKVGESLELEDQLGPLHKLSTMEPVTEPAMEPVTEPAMESVTESSEAILKSKCDLSMQQSSDKPSSDSSTTSRHFQRGIEKVFIPYPLWTSEEALMDQIKGFSLDLEKVSQDFAMLTPPEFSSNIVLRFIHYNDKSYDFAWIEKITDAMKGNPGKNWPQKRICQKSLGPAFLRQKRKVKRSIPMHDPSVDHYGYEVLLDGVEKRYWRMVLSRAFFDEEVDIDDDDDVWDDEGRCYYKNRMATEDDFCFWDDDFGSWF